MFSILVNYSNNVVEILLDMKIKSFSQAISMENSEQDKKELLNGWRMQLDCQYEKTFLALLFALQAFFQKRHTFVNTQDVTFDIDTGRPAIRKTSF